MLGVVDGVRMRPLRTPARARRTVGAATVVVLAASLLTLEATTPAAAERSDRAPGRGADGALLERPLRGPTVLRRLADGELAEAARRNGRSTEALREILEDPSTGLGTSGRVFYAEPAPAKRETAPRTSTETSSTSAATSYPLEKTFQLHSRPGALRTLYIDFDGHLVSGTAWDSQAGWPATTYPGFVTSLAEATDDQRRAVQTVWRRVAEDFAPFNIDVTTEDPGTAALERTSGADSAYGMRALVVDTGRSLAVRTAVEDPARCGGCVGIAWMGSWGDVSASLLQPALIFSDLVDDDPWQIAETVTHEAGHGFDLEHDGIERSDGSLDPYYTGHGAWSPIMGASSRGLTQWSSGEYPGATETQDDLAMIAHRTTWDGHPAVAPVVRDDHGDSPATATGLGTGSAVTATGLISTRTDRDVFALTRDCMEPIQVTAAPVATGPNLDIALRVLDADGAVLTDVNPTATADTSVWPPVVSGLGATATVLSPQPGTHYIEVTGGGQGTASTGWTDYASLGTYTLAVESCADEERAVTEPTPEPTPELTPEPTPEVTPEPAPQVIVRPPGRPAPLRVLRGPRGGPRTLVVRWGTAADRGTPVTGYVVRLRKVADGRIVKIARRVVGPGTRRTVWRLEPGRYRFMVRATSGAGPGLRTKWSWAKRPR